MRLIKANSPTLPGLGLLLVLGLGGCHNRESMVPGKWTGGQGDSLELKADKSWTATLPMGITGEGTWSFDGKDVTITPVKLAGKPISEMKQKMQALVASRGAEAQKLADNVDKPDMLTLSDDGKTLTTDKTKDKAEKSITLTKAE